FATTRLFVGWINDGEEGVIGLDLFLTGTVYGSPPSLFLDSNFSYNAHDHGSADFIHHASAASASDGRYPSTLSDAG
ncbi:MAG: hypothetical protein OEY77_16020, partial [Nitrospira sp.]|nr:hypothetical protein [Nitrospira sp.]